jgi:hypothetical protein
MDARKQMSLASVLFCFTEGGAGADWIRCTQSFACEYSNAKRGEESKTGRMTGRLEENKKQEDSQEGLNK